MEQILIYVRQNDRELERKEEKNTENWQNLLKNICAHQQHMPMYALKKYFPQLKNINNNNL